MTAADLQALKARLNLTVPELMTRLGLSQRQVYRLLSGENKISGAALLLARLLEKEAKR